MAAAHLQFLSGTVRAYYRGLYKRPLYYWIWDSSTFRYPYWSFEWFFRPGFIGRDWPMFPCGCEGSVGEYGIVCVNSKVLSLYLLCLLKMAAGRLMGLLGWFAAWLSTMGTWCMTLLWNCMQMNNNCQYIGKRTRIFEKRENVRSAMLGRDIDQQREGWEALEHHQPGWALWMQLFRLFEM